MTKESIDAMIAAYGERIIGFKIDNSNSILLRLTKSSPTIKDVRTEAFAGIDYLILKQRDPTSNENYEVYYLIETIQSMYIGDDKDGYVDPVRLR